MPNLLTAYTLCDVFLNLLHAQGEVFCINKDCISDDDTLVEALYVHGHGVGRSTWALADPNRNRMMDAVEWTAIDGSRVRRTRVVDFQMDASLAMAQLRDLTETFARYSATMEGNTNETIMAIHHLRLLMDGVRQNTMQSLDLNWSAEHRLHLRVAELKDLVEKVMRQVEMLSGVQAPGSVGLDNRIDFMEDQLDVLKSGLAALEQEIAGLSQAQGDHPQGLGEVQDGVQSINAEADRADEAVRAAPDQLKVISNRMDQTAASVVAQTEQLQLQMEEFKAKETRLGQLEALRAPNEAAKNADPSQVNVLLESLARLEHEPAKYRGATTNTQRRQQEVLRETQDQVVQLAVRILETEDDRRGLKTLDHVGQIEARLQALEDPAKTTEGPKTSPAPGPPESLDQNAVAYLERELGQVKSYLEGKMRTLGHNMDTLMAQLQEEHLEPRGVNPIDRGYYPDRAEPAPGGPFGGYFSEPPRVSGAGPSNLFMHPQRNRPDGFHCETH